MRLLVNITLLKDIQSIAIEHQENGQLIVVTERVAEEKEQAKVDIAFDFVHRRPHKKKYLA